MSVIKGNKEYFKGFGKIKFEGKSSKNHFHIDIMIRISMFWVNQ
ncbi:MAG: hypothetical protein Ct9H90mP3_5750 [Flammeovirgaceae bacterium]|nr:MAG: hypothetical protein Ct9H90mP3_5750 [Flammeovirgaceae bacterium]